mmetsp:Transcript_43305/g.119773  ORF Transcript_43305/g.119773 Transcript_43305/m.119773 type:complete len:186 (+) Transcript_43305:99-656(+)
MGAACGCAEGCLGPLLHARRQTLASGATASDAVASELGGVSEPMRATATAPGYTLLYAPSPPGSAQPLTACGGVSPGGGPSRNRVLLRNDTATACRAEVFLRSWGRREHALFRCEVPARGTAPPFEPREQSRHYSVAFLALDGQRLDEISGVTCESGDVRVRLRGAGPGGTGPPMAAMEYSRPKS